MSGIDKLCMEVPHVNTRDTQAGLTLQYIIDYARSNGLSYIQRWFAHENKPAIAFMDHNGIVPGCQVGYMGRLNGALITRIELNPSLFPSIESLNSLLSRTGLSGIRDCIATRIDIAADYSTPYGDLIQGLDISDRSNTTVYLDQRRGLPRTIYFGADKDIILAYDKEFEQQRRINAPATGVRTRIERQLRTKRIIRNCFGYDIYLANLRDAMQSLYSNRVRIFEDVTLFNVTFRPDSEYLPRQLRQRYMMEGMIKLTSYANMRRYINATENGNYIRDWRSLCTVTPLPPEQQPDAVLRQAMLRFAYRRRRQPPSDISATVA